MISVFLLEFQKEEQWQSSRARNKKANKKTAWNQQIGTSRGLFLSIKFLFEYLLIYLNARVTKGSLVANDPLNLTLQDLAAQSQDSRKSNGNRVHIQKENGISTGEVPKPSIDKEEEASHVKNISQGDIPFSGPLQVSTSSGFAWAKRRKDDVPIRSHTRSISRGHIFNPVEPSVALHAKNSCDLKRHENGDVMHRGRTESRGHDSYEIAKLAIQNQWGKFERPDSFDASDVYHSQELSLALYQREGLGATKSDLVSL